MRPHSGKQGFVLLTTVVLLAICVIVIGAVVGYTSFTTRMTRIHLGNSVCRLAAQSAIENAKRDIYKTFYSYTGANTIKIGLLSGSAFDWFESYSPGSPTTSSYIGSSGKRVTLKGTNICNCVVRPWIKQTIRPSNASWAIVVLRATATLDNPGAPASSITIEERVRFALMRSRVFDYAYFVNNYGWFQGSSITANGDVRANGNLYLDAKCVVNGRVYASANDELKVIGTIENEGTYQDLTTYWNNCGTYARPSTPASKNGEKVGGGYDVPKSTNSRLYPYQDELTMPYISALDQYITYAEQQNGKLSGGLRYSIDTSTGNVKSTANTTINAHYSGNGPSGNASRSDKGALVLEGTSTNPIVIDGPVVVDSDVVIKGYVKGQGTIYSGRNIHIVGDIKYVNAPSWPHPDTNPTATTKKNAEKDLLGLAAKGNIVLGDYTLTDSRGSNLWLGSSTSGLQYYLKSGPYVQKYICDESDLNIGYPRSTQYGYTANESRFCGDYTQVDGGKSIDVTTKSETKYVNGRRQTVTTTTITDIKDRRYYESVCGKKIINALCTDTVKNGNYNSTIARIDAVMYNNHGVLGHLGACTINGSLVCRNEAMLYTTSLKINWDHRLYSGLADSALNRMGLPMDASQPPATLSWREITH